MSNEEIYKCELFSLPRVYCKDGFNISIQTNCISYCKSENGLRQYGKNWEMVEWGYPSMPINAEKYKADIPRDTMGSMGAYISVKTLQELMDEHGGIDMDTTIIQFANTINDIGK